jgi:hypothetical protein
MPRELVYSGDRMRGQVHGLARHRVARRRAHYAAGGGGGGFGGLGGGGFGGLDMATRQVK